MIPFLDVRAGYLELREELDEAYHRVMDAGSFILGREVDEFEEEFAAYCDTHHCVSLGNGLDALQLALRALDIGPGDEVLVPSNTFIATWLAVSAVGAIPVAVEPDPATFNIDPTRLKTAITRQTRAVIVVHLYGQPADFDAVYDVAADHELYVIEDAAQAHGGRNRGRRVGSLGECACFSFYPGKNLGAFGDGGAVTTHDGAIAERLRQLRNYGSSRKYEHDKIGGNSRLDELQAAFLRVKLRRLDEWNQRRQHLASIYHQVLHEAAVISPIVPNWADPIWHLFVVQCAARDELQKYLANEAIGTLVHYPIPPHKSGAYSAGGWRGGRLPIAERLARQALSLPIGPHMSEDDVIRVSEAVKRFQPLAVRRAA